jgi:hypothetical protein
MDAAKLTLLPSVHQALLLPQYWSSFIRSGSLEDVRPLGLGAKP